ncbi:hypothetical protein VPH35_011563 [Triticum aestivum]
MESPPLPPPSLDVLPVCNNQGGLKRPKTENASNTIAMGARPGFHIFFGVIKRKPRPDHIATSEDKQSNVASANFAGRPSTVASADFAGRPSVVISAYFAAGIFFFANYDATIFDLQPEPTDGYRMKKTRI